MVRTVVTYPLCISSMAIHAPGRSRSNSLFERPISRRFRPGYSSRWEPESLATLTAPVVGLLSRVVQWGPRGGAEASRQNWASQSLVGKRMLL
jgi:hypothetical protein